MGLSFIGDKHYLLTAGEDSVIQTFNMSGEPVGVLTRGRMLDGILRRKWDSPIDIEARKERRQKEAEDYMQKLALQPLTRSTYIAQQMYKWPKMFTVIDQKAVNEIRMQRGDETPSPSENTSIATEPVHEIRDEPTMEALIDNPSLARKYVLEQIVPPVMHSTGKKISGTIEDDNDLESLVTEKGPGGMETLTSIAKRKAMIEKQEHRYLDSVTLDADKLIEKINFELNSLSMVDSSCGMSSSILEYKQRTEHEKLRVEAEKQGSFRQSFLYPNL